jgi:threonine synthase
MADAAYTYDYSPALVPAADERGEGMWRWRRLLPLDGADVFPLPVGGTPLVAPPRLRAALDLPGLLLKDETRSFSGSNKDRATALCLADAARRGAPAVVAASSGNLAVSCAAGAAAVGIPAHLFVSTHTVSPHKVALMRAYGATVWRVDGPYEDAYRLSEAVCARLGWYNRNTGTNPLAVQGKKTVAFEVWEQMGRTLPDLAYVPVGDGTTIAAFVVGCEELVRCGVAARVPRVIGVQATGAAPLVAAYAAGRVDWTPVPSTTFADGIGVGDPFFGRAALEGVRRTDGEYVAVDDDAIRAAIALLAQTSGLLAEPAGAAALAGAIAHCAQHRPGEERVLVLVTGTGLKDQRWLPQGGGAAIEVGPSLDAFLAALERADGSDST